MTHKRTHGPCHGTSGGCSPDSMGVWAHTASCPSLYPAQQEPDALTEVARLVRMMKKEQLQRRSDELAERVLDLISEAREEQRKAREHGWNDGLEEAARFLEVVFDQPTMAQDVRAKKAKP